jgi:signal transduction histidine kinase
MSAWLGWAWGWLGQLPVPRVDPDVLRLERLIDLAIALAYFCLPWRLWALIGRGEVRHPGVALYLTLLLGLCGGTHLFKVATGYAPGLLPPALGEYLVTAVVAWTAVLVLGRVLRALGPEDPPRRRRALGAAAAAARAYLGMAGAALVLVLVGGWGYTALADLIAVAAECRADVAVATRLVRSARAVQLAIPTVGVLALVVLGTSIVLGIRQARARAAAEAELRWAREQAHENARILSALSHDLRTPLHTIAMHATLAAMYAEDEPPAPAVLVALREAMGEINRLIALLVEMVEGFLEVSRAESVGAARPVRFPARALLDDVARVVQAEARIRGIAVRLECPGELAIETDRRILTRVLMNLASNAVKFTDDGHVTLRALPVPGPVPAVRLEVQDTGCGIPADVLPRLFRDFEQGGRNPARDARQGYGLGLSIAQRLARQLGTDITVESSPGKGSKFRLIVPAAVGSIAKA